MKMKQTNNKPVPTAISIFLLVIALLVSRFLLPGSNDIDVSENPTSVVDSVEEKDTDQQEEVNQEDGQQREEQVADVQVADVQEETSVSEPDQTDAAGSDTAEVTLRFRNKKLLNGHYEKHGKDMGFASAEEYEAAAAKVVTNPEVLHKTESEDGDDVYYVESTNEFVVVAKDGYIRTYFLPDAGKRYYDRQ